VCVKYSRSLLPNNVHQKLTKHISVQEKGEDSVDLMGTEHADAPAAHQVGNGRTDTHNGGANVEVVTVEVESSLCHENNHTDSTQTLTTDGNRDSVEATATGAELSVNGGIGNPSGEATSGPPISTAALDTDLSSTADSTVGEDLPSKPSVGDARNEASVTVDSSTSCIRQSPETSGEEDQIKVDVEASLLPSMAFKTRKKSSLSCSSSEHYSDPLNRKTSYDRQSSRSSQEGKDIYLESSNEDVKGKNRPERTSTGGSLPSSRKEIIKMLQRIEKVGLETKELVKRNGTVTREENQELMNIAGVINKTTAATSQDVTVIKQRREEESEL